MYATVDQVRSLSELIKKSTELTEQVISSYIMKAQARIDGYLSIRYLLPFAEPVPKIISSIAADMAAAFIIDEKISEREIGKTTFADVLMKRAEKDLSGVIEKGLIDREPAVVLVAPAGTQTGPQMATTTPGTSPMKDVLNQW